jgi:hypothetical protein
MKKKLTEELITKGVPEEACKCPLALLLKEAYPQSKIWVDVAEGVPDVYVDDHRVTFADPEKIVEFITRFDNKKKVAPFFVEWEDF